MFAELMMVPRKQQGRGWERPAARVEVERKRNTGRKRKTRGRSEDLGSNHGNHN